MITNLQSLEDNTCCAGNHGNFGFPDIQHLQCCSESGGHLTIELGTDLVDVGNTSSNPCDILLHVELPLDPCEDLGHLENSKKVVSTGKMEGGLSSSCVVSPGRNFGLDPLDLTRDEMSAQSSISSSIREAMSFVSGCDRLDPLPNLSACTDRFELKQKRTENGVNLHSSDSNENAIQQDSTIVSDTQIHGTSCWSSTILEKRSRKVLLEQNSCVYKRRKLRNSVTLLPEHTQMALGKESLPKSQVNSNQLVQLEKNGILSETEINSKRHDKRPVAGPESRDPGKSEKISEIEISCKRYDKRPIAGDQTRYTEKNGTLLENGVNHQRNDKMQISGSHTGNLGNVLQPWKTVSISDSNRVLQVKQNETCLGMPIGCMVPDRKTTDRSLSGSSSCFSDSGEDQNNESVFEVTCKRRSASEDCEGLLNQGDSSLANLTGKFGRNADTMKREIPVLGPCISSGIEATEVAREKDPEREWCISILKESRLLATSFGKSSATEHPGVVGDGRCSKNCKVCGTLEDSSATLICDMCEESFHMVCCNLKVTSIPEDDWYCPTCRKKRKRTVTKSSIENSIHKDGQKVQTAIPDKAVQHKGTEDKADILWRMLQDDEAYTTQVRIGKEYQADVPCWTGRATESAESSLTGELVTLEEKLLEKEHAEQNLKNDVWPKDWKPASALPPGSRENWLQCQNVLYYEGDICPDGRKAKKDIICGKWRRAPLSQVQNDEWDCSCALVWDPFHADCAVPQELETEDILKRLKASEMEASWKGCIRI
eukprot:Gb_36175 [translate_table: standard]